MNTCLLHLGSILKAAEELSLVEKPFPSCNTSNSAQD